MNKRAKKRGIEQCRQLLKPPKDIMSNQPSLQKLDELINHSDCSLL